MTYGQAFDFCMAGGKVLAIKKYFDGTINLSLLIWYDKENGVFVHKPTCRADNVVSHESAFLQHDETMSALSKWTFEDAEPRPRFEVRAEIDDDFLMHITVMSNNSVVCFADRDDAVQLCEALNKAMRCDSCGEYLDANGECGTGRHDERI